MPMRLLTSATFLAALAGLSVASRPARAQHEGHESATVPDSMDAMSRSRWHLMAQAIPVVTRAARSIGGRDFTEGYVSQAALMGRGDLLSGHLRLETTLNAEGLTMKRGELSTGAFGEGYVDRRHPHTYLHEIIASA